MPWLRHASLGTLIGPTPSDGPLYMELAKQRVSNRPVWEDVGEQEVQSVLAAAGFAVTDPSQAEAFATIVPAITANAATANFTMGRAQRAATLVKAVYIPVSAVTGQGTNYRTINVINAGQAGAGTTNMAGYALTAGNNLAQNAENTITLNGTQANLAATPGDLINWQSALTGTGLADPGGIAVATFAYAG